MARRTVRAETDPPIWSPGKFAVGGPGEGFPWHCGAGGRRPQGRLGHSLTLHEPMEQFRNGWDLAPPNASDPSPDVSAERVKETAPTFRATNHDSEITRSS